ncbi:MAG: hypothetical protein A2W00_06000 [Candidatus Eisenbacteria bacterium RBG_16_71_46]|nr:MAG: hypothetical protein A2W00_06000 [Candidatus Eisenbacteria bacterium RBG_16_71_46]
MPRDTSSVSVHRLALMIRCVLSRRTESSSEAVAPPASVLPRSVASPRIAASRAASICASGPER